MDMLSMKIKRATCSKVKTKKEKQSAKTWQKIRDRPNYQLKRIISSNLVVLPTANFTSK